MDDCFVSLDANSVDNTVDFDAAHAEISQGKLLDSDGCNIGIQKHCVESDDVVVSEATSLDCITEIIDIEVSFEDDVFDGIFDAEMFNDGCMDDKGVWNVLLAIINWDETVPIDGVGSTDVEIPVFSVDEAIVISLIVDSIALMNFHTLSSIREAVFVCDKNAWLSKTVDLIDGNEIMLCVGDSVADWTKVILSDDSIEDNEMLLDAGESIDDIAGWMKRVLAVGLIDDNKVLLDNGGLIETSSCWIEKLLEDEIDNGEAFIYDDSISAEDVVKVIDGVPNKAVLVRNVWWAVDNNKPLEVDSV